MNSESVILRRGENPSPRARLSLAAGFVNPVLKWRHSQAGCHLLGNIPLSMLNSLSHSSRCLSCNRPIQHACQASAESVSTTEAVCHTVSHNRMVEDESNSIPSIGSNGQRHICSPCDRCRCRKGVQQKWKGSELDMCVIEPKCNHGNHGL